MRRLWIAARAGIAAAVVVVVVASGLAHASDVDVAVVDATAPTGQVSIAQGASAPIVINLQVTGNQAGTATFKVFRSWMLSGGSFSGSDPVSFEVPPRGPNDPATTFGITGTISVASDQAPAGPFPLAVAPFDITNSNATGAKLKAGSASSYQVTVTAAPATPPPTIAPPVVTVPGDIVAEATGPGGAVVSYSASAVDGNNQPVEVTCTPASGSQFPLGPTVVTCSATNAGGTTEKSFTITVVDETPPSLTLPADIATFATSAAGAPVSFVATATDLVDGDVPVVCTPPSGSVFPPGETTVACTAVDAAGNPAQGSFTVTVTFLFSGFRQPVDNRILNGMKAGSTAPIKWQVPDGSGGFIGDVTIVDRIASGVMSCSSTVPTDSLEEYATGGTTLRYDAAAETYVYNWQSPKKPGTCYRVAITFVDGQTYTAAFQLR